MKLSILIPSLPSRYEQLWYLLSKLTPQITDDVELIILTDNKKITLWEKRNKMVSLAHGDYIVFLDDDDDISDDYVSSLLDATHYNTDVICYKMKCSVEWQPYKMVHFSKDFVNWQTYIEYFRKPNHLMCYRKDILQKAKWQDITYWEDMIFSEEVSKYIKTEHIIDKVLYYYNYFSSLSECPVWK